MVGLFVWQCTDRGLEMALRIPQPPLDDSPQELKRALNDMTTFLRTMFNNGTKQATFTQAQIDGFTDQSFLGTTLFNTDTGESNVSYLDGGVVKWRAF